MLDIGRYLAEAIYFVQYTIAQLLWMVNRATLAIAAILDSITGWLTDNVAYFVELMVNALSAPLRRHVHPGPDRPRLLVLYSTTSCPPTAG
jgi:hypothetical protein